MPSKEFPSRIHMQFRFAERFNLFENYESVAMEKKIYHQNKSLHYIEYIFSKNAAMDLANALMLNVLSIHFKSIYITHSHRESEAQKSNAWLCLYLCRCLYLYSMQFKCEFPECKKGIWNVKEKETQRWVAPESANAYALDVYIDSVNQNIDSVCHGRNFI